MSNWFLSLSLIGKLWLVYAGGVALLFGLAAYLEFRPAPRVDGAGGWMLFGAMMLSFYGFLLAVLASLLILLLRWLW